MKRLKRITVFVMMLLMLLPTVAMAATPYSTYTYSIDGELLNSPDAYVPDVRIDYKTLGLDKEFNTPSDIESDKAGNIYITDSKNHRIVVTDKYYNYKYTIEKFVNQNGVDDSFDTPQSTFVVDEGEMKGLYVCDTNNKRIVVFNQDDQSFIREIGEPDADLLTANGSKFTPRSCVVDKHGRIYVASQDTLEGIIVMTSQGQFINFIGAPKVTVTAFEALVKKLTGAESTKLPTTYQNLDIDSTTEEFVYGTIVFNKEEDLESQASAITTKVSDYSPVRLLNATGVDIMHRNGFFAPAGEVNVELNTVRTSSNADAPTGVSSVIDISSGPNGVWSIIDAKRSKVYTYDSDGNLLYIFGDKGAQLGNITSAKSITYQGSNILVLDAASFTVFRRTEYAEILDEAIYYQ